MKKGRGPGIFCLMLLSATVLFFEKGIVQAAEGETAAPVRRPSTLNNQAVQQPQAEVRPPVPGASGENNGRFSPPIKLSTNGQNQGNGQTVSAGMQSGQAQSGQAQNAPVDQGNLGSIAKPNLPWAGEAMDPESQAAAQKLINEAYTQSLQQTMPFSPDRIGELRRFGLQVEGAQQLPPPNAGQARFRSLSLEPGATIPQIRLYPENVSVVRMLDASGAPWPILSFMVGNESGYNVQQGGGESGYASNTLMVTPRANVASSNLAIILYPDIPCIMQLTTDARKGGGEFLVTFRVEGKGPLAAEESFVPEQVSMTNPTMLSFLDGVAPEGSEVLRVSEKTIQGWHYNKKNYLRTPMKLLWPAYSKSISSGGQNPLYVYELSGSVMQFLFAGKSGNTDVLASRYSSAAQNALSR